MGSAGSRDLRIDNRPITRTGDVDRWALLVGVSKYAHQDLNLKFAARDASRLREALLEPTAGAFPDEHVLELVDEKATLANLFKALRTFLKKPAPDDLVVLFLACHGSRDRDRPDNLYLLAHDTDPTDISGTGLPMRDVELALKETLLSQRVVVLADTCHSGGLGDAFADIRAAHDDAADYNTYLNELSTARGGVSLMTSAMANESSVEGKQWGKGHGVFTHFLLEGLRGKADRPPHDGVITAGELFDYVQQQVEKATQGKQHPHISAGADRELVLAVTRSLSARQHLELADRLAEAAELLGEPTCWRGAAVQYGEAMRLQRDPRNAELGVKQALALYRSGDPEAAERALRPLSPDAVRVRRTVGLLQLAHGREEDARKTLLMPQPIEPWAPLLFSPSLPRGRRAALLIALDSVDPAAYNGWEGRLRSPVAETNALAKVLESVFGFDEQVLLINSEATASAVQSSLHELVENSSSCEAVVVCLSGHGGQIPVPDEPGHSVDSTFVAFDAQITSAEIDALLSQSTADRTTLIASTAHSGRFAERAAVGGYEAITSCAENQFDMESALDPQYSVFFEALLPHLTLDVDGNEVAESTRASMKQPLSSQEPQFALNGDLPPFVGGADRKGASGAGALFAQVLLGATAAVNTRMLDQIVEFVVAGELPQATATTLASEWWRRSELGRLARLREDLSPTSLTALCGAASAAARHRTVLTLKEALDRIGRAPAVEADPTLLADVHELARTTRRSGGIPSRLRAVLVGVSSLGDGGAGIKRAGDSVAAVHAALIDAGVPPKRVAVLVDSDATVAAVRAALRRVGRGAEHPVLVYWCGPGSLAEMRCFDGGVVGEDEVHTLAGPTASLVAEGLEAAVPSATTGAPPVERRITLLAAGSGRGRSAGTVWYPRPDGRPGKARYGRLTVALVEALRDADDLSSIRVSALADSTGQPTVMGIPARDVLLTDPVSDHVDALVDRVRDAEVQATGQLVADLLDRRNGVDAEAHLQLGVLRAQGADVDEAVSALERAIEQFGANSRGRAKARLHLGRVLLDSGRDRARAVSECRRATEDDPELVAAWFWLGRAIAELVERETVAEASAALRTYLARGAPVGRRAEVARLLEAMSAKAATR